VAVRVALISTAAPGSLGSMVTYAALVQEALARHAQEVEVVPVCVLPSGSGAATRSPDRLALLNQIREARKAARVIQADVYHLLDASHAYMADTLPASRTVVTVHDLIPALQAMGRFPVPGPGWAARWLIGRSLRFVGRAGSVATVSRSTAKDLAEIVGRQADVVIHSPLRTMAADLSDDGCQYPPATRNALQVIHIGNNGFYKNRLGVLRIFAAMLTRMPSLELTMAGPPPDRSQAELVDSLNLRPHVHYVLNPSDLEVEKLYRQSAILLFPSLYEGYGWPPLEALRLGCNVVCSDRGSLPEVVGSAALYADPDQIDIFAQQALRLLQDSSLRIELLAKGVERLGSLTLDGMASALLEQYRKLLPPND
jgi:glycosyltransferase involved in cell wall biosynthesis